MKSALLFLLIIFSPTLQDIPEPDFSLRPYFLKEDKLNEFERVDAVFESKAKGMGYGGVEISYAAEGLKSAVRFTSLLAPRIIIKMEDNSDPAEGFAVFMAEIKKDRRRFVTGKMGSAFGSNKSNNEKRVQISAKKIREKVFEISFQQNLSPGEYAIIPSQKNMSMSAGSQSMKMSCFGVD
ncbi:MAG TPA: hypothetical protein VGQ59_01860 [Cyclobacteriaceae bacterium]|jgi:hypothetical protein|nr:hypothetical protein [Cyclobacteriaceae bacterium]